MAPPSLVSVPLLRSTTVALPKWPPEQHVWNSFGDALSVRFMMLKLEIDTLPADAPPLPDPMVTGFEAPQENEYSSNAFFSFIFSSVVSPSGRTAPLLGSSN